MAAESGENGQSDLESELVRLREEHRDLDGAIEALEQSVAGDQLQIQRLKKRKLTLRDRISHIEDVLTPDIIA
ncbi:YdcH family protein [Methylobacterium sp. SD21]|uniref:YdcH family protein n=1 Tax=Methylobacterium litchii TaxID=3138810 RepID=UPI00313D5B64